MLAPSAQIDAARAAHRRARVAVERNRPAVLIEGRCAGVELPPLPNAMLALFCKVTCRKS